MLTVLQSDHPMMETFLSKQSHCCSHSVARQSLAMEQTVAPRPGAADWTQ